MTLADRIKGMGIAWFSFNLATSAIILASFALGAVTRTAPLIALARILAYLNTAAFAAIAAAFIVKLALVGRQAAQMIRDPVRGPFTTVISIAVMLLALDWSIVLGNPWVAAGFFYAGMILHTILFIVTTYYMLMHPGIEIHMMNPGWYMPPVGNILVPYIGALLASKGIPVSMSLMGVYLGTGLLFWIALFAIWLYRSIFHHPPPGSMVPLIWINLAPPSVAALSYEAMMGLGPIGYHRLVAALEKAHLEACIHILHALYYSIYYTFWGLAGLLFALIIVVTLAYATRGRMEFAESWWAFVFPVAAYSISTIHLYMHTREPWLLYYASFLYALTWLLYLITTIYSIYHALHTRRQG